MKVAIKGLQSSLAEPIALFVGTASFEDRCRTIYEGLAKRPPKSLIFKNAQAGPNAERNLQLMMSAGGESAERRDVDLDDPVATARSLAAVAVSANDAPAGCIFVDITTFTHEQLLILYRVLEQARPDRGIVFGYTGADQYSVNTEAAGAWLSRGVSQVRSVLGFPGSLRPSRRLHLVLLVGFEHERARAVIEAFEPSVLTLGVGMQSQSVSERHFQTNRRFFEDVQKFVEVRTTLGSAVNTFVFSCVDPDAARHSILAEVSRFRDHNTVICPMNTKLSTLGAALAATTEPEVQLCYSRAIEYNEAGYSTPSDQATLFHHRFS